MGHTSEKDLPLTWDGKTRENLLWKVPLGGIGNSSPIVWGDRVFVTVSRRQSNLEQDAKVITEHWVSCFQARGRVKQPGSQPGDGPYFPQLGDLGLWHEETSEATLRQSRR
jgi:hypothetical protein